MPRANGREVEWRGGGLSFGITRYDTHTHNTSDTPLRPGSTPHDDQDAHRCETRTACSVTREGGKKAKKKKVQTVRRRCTIQLSCSVRRRAILREIHTQIHKHTNKQGKHVPTLSPLPNHHLNHHFFFSVSLTSCTPVDAIVSPNARHTAVACTPRKLDGCKEKTEK